jgi:aminopeptidase-like protein
MKDAAVREMAILWVLNLSDGQHDLLDIAARSGLPFDQIGSAVEALREADLLKPVEKKGTQDAHVS